MKFINHVKEHFEFLTTDHSFRLEATYERGDTASVRYSSDRVYVVVSRGPPDFEPKLHFGRIGVDDQPGSTGFEQGDLIMLSCCSNWEWQHDPKSPYGSIIPEFSRLLRKCGKRCLNADDFAFSEMAERRSNLAKEWLVAEKAQVARRRADLAWEEKRFCDVVWHYSSILNSLSESESKRLAYAQKHQSK